MGCHTNEQSIELPRSLEILSPMDALPSEACVVIDSNGEERMLENSECQETTSTPLDSQHMLSIVMPSSHVVEISQNFYWPLYSVPLEWIFQERGSEFLRFSDEEKRRHARRVAEQLNDLEFFQPVKDDTKADETAEMTVRKIQTEVLMQKDDWFGELSGGQKSKVELVRKVFLQGHCPGVLLIDETMAPLDPASKALVMSKLKAFCKDSVVIVIYHTDVGKDVKDEETKARDCVPSSGFFDKNLHLEKGQILIRPTC